MGQGGGGGVEDVNSKNVAMEGLQRAHGTCDPTGLEQGLENWLVVHIQPVTLVFCVYFDFRAQGIRMVFTL